jgi:hypothetical protein
MQIKFHPDAAIELNEAIEYYEEIETGLGFDLAIEVHSTVKRIVLFPDAWPIIDNDIRRCLVRRFPYGVLYPFMGSDPFFRFFSPANSSKSSESLLCNIILSGIQTKPKPMLLSTT